VGRDFDEIVRSANFNVVIGRDDREVHDRLDWIGEQYRRAGLSEDKVAHQVKSAASGPLVGTPEKIIETLRRLQGDGLAYAITYFAEAAYDNSAIALFEQEVMPEIVDRDDHGHLHHLFHRR
jgi:alkanesulfonate monooxygenase SsuD/methylene tetrahydromethanopterin reductase-like flavin-dependent oxidoreductase (luciferase family)